MASALKKIKKRFEKGKRKDDEEEEKDSLESASPGQKSHLKQLNKPSVNTKKTVDNHESPVTGATVAGPVTDKPSNPVISEKAANVVQEHPVAGHSATAVPLSGKAPSPTNGDISADGITASGHTSSNGNQESPLTSTTTTAGAASESAPANPVNGGTSVASVTAASHTSSHGIQEWPVTATTTIAGSASGGVPSNPVSSAMSTNGGTASGNTSSTGDQETPVTTATTTAGSASDGVPSNAVNTTMSTDGGTALHDTSSRGNQESHTPDAAAAAAAAATTASGDSQTPEGIASDSGIKSSSPQHPSVSTAAVPSNEGESSLQSLSGHPVQEEAEATGGDDTATGEETAQQDETTKSFEQFFVSEKINGDRFLQDKLALGLDRTSHRLIKTWEHLACTKEIEAPLEVRLRCKMNSENSCTLMLFEVLTAEKEDIKVKDLISALTTMKRNDVKKIITDVYSNAGDSTEKFSDFAASHANSTIITKMATQLDQKSRVNQHWLHLGQQFKVSGERLKEIEYGQFSPTEVLMEYLYSKKTDLTIGLFYDEVKKLNRYDVLKKLDPFIIEAVDREKLMKDVIELDSDAMRGICVCLNNPNRVLKNWRHLAKACAFGIPNDIYKDCNPEKPKSPTESLFEWIFADRVELTVGQLCSALGKIDRNDIVRDLREHFQQN